MSKISKLLARPKTIEIKGETFDIHPLTIEELDIIVKMDNAQTRAIAMKELIVKTLKKAVPDATDEEINNISLEHLNVIMDAIAEVNGLSDERIKQLKE